MEIGSREWLIVGAIIFILLIVIDGWRRMRAQNNSLKIDIDDKIAELGDDDYNPELPIGSARVYVPSDKDLKPDNKKVTEQNSQVIEESTRDDLVQATEPAVDQISNKIAVPEILTSSTVHQKIEQSISAENFALDSEQKLSSSDTTFDALASLGNAEGILNNAVPEKENYREDKSLNQNEIAESNIVSSYVDENDAEDKNTTDKDLDSLEPENTDVLDSQDEKKSELENNVLPQMAQTEDDLADNINTENELNVPDREFGVDTFEQLLAERELQSNDDAFSHDALSEEENPETADNIKHLNDENDELKSLAVLSASSYIREEVIGLNPTLDSQREESAPSLSDEAKEHEIAALKARLKQLSENNDLIDDKESVSSSDVPDEKVAVDKSKSHKEIAAIEQALESQNNITEESTDRALDDIEIDQGVSDVMNDQEAEQQEPLQQLSNDETTVIDDDVDLTEFDQEVTNLSAEKILEQLDNIALELGEIAENTVDSGDENQDVSEISKSEAKESDLGSEEIISSLSGLSALAEETNNDLKDDDIETNKTSVFDQDADPLMDGFQDEQSSNRLVEQFNSDLEDDEQLVSNEFDMPITEILKKKKLKENDSPTKKSGLSNSIDSSMERQNETLAADQDDRADSKITAQAEVNEIDAISDINLGFSAFDDEPLEAEGVSSTEQVREEGEELLEDEHSQKRVEGTDRQSIDDAALINQTSLFDDIDENFEVESMSSKDSSRSESVIRKPRKTIANIDDPDVVLIVTVVAKESYLDGQALKQVVEACGMEFGDMDVFHRFEEGKDQGAVQFSMANAVNPGTFDINTMEETSTPGVSFFMSMDEPLDPKNALDCMLATAETVANHLNGDLLDDDRSVLRPQTKEHYRERIRIHEMNKLRRRAQ